MKILCVVGKEEINKALNMHLNPLGFEFINYSHPVKAMDNIDEIAPDIVIFSAEDFPRHWKPFIILLRKSFDRKKTIFVLLKGNNFSIEEAAKAMFLGVNGIIQEDFQDKEELDHIQKLFSRYVEIKQSRSNNRYIPRAYDKINFMFTHPASLKIISGLVSDLSLEGACFQPDNPSLTFDLERNSIIENCSLRVGNEIIEINAKVIRNNKMIAFNFVNLTESNKEIIQTYIENNVQREIESIKNQRVS